MDQRPAVANLATVAILPISEDVPLFQFTLELQYALNAIGNYDKIKYLSMNYIYVHLKKTSTIFIQMVNAKKLCTVAYESGTNLTNLVVSGS